MFVKFLVVGVGNAIVGLSCIYFAMYFLGLSDALANAFGYGVGILFGFALNKRWTFANDGKIIGTLLRYVLVLAVAYIVNIEIVMAAITEFQIDRYLAQPLGIAPYTLIGFLGSKYFVFRSKKASKKLEDADAFMETGLAKIVAKPVSLGIVVPCYNEEEVLPETAARLAKLLADLIGRRFLAESSRVYFVDDGSRDKTWQLIEALAAENPMLKGIKLSRNRGHQNALLAGLLTAEGEALISIDADLQDDLGAIEKMLLAYAAGYDIVYGVRRSRDTDTAFKRLTARGYYHLIHAMGVDIVFDHADYRLMSRQALEALRGFSEVNLFLRGIIPQLGYRFTLVYYDRAERYAGESKYPLRKMLAFAWQGITSFSATPLRLITGLGFVVSFGSFIVTLWGLWVRFFTDQALPGWASTVLPIYFLGGIQLLCLGIIGEYLAKIYLETKRRPRFVIEKVV
jgi:glycosyltransferase involved in cell wall biosynthesis/putative flippase GtrA